MNVLIASSLPLGGVCEYWDDVAEYPWGPLDLFGPAFDAFSEIMML